MSKTNVSGEVIEQFLEGRDPQKYIVSIEANKYEPFVSLIINDPKQGKRIEKHRAVPFLWIKQELVGHLYGGDREATKRAISKYKIDIKKLNKEDENGNIPSRIENGYEFLVSTPNSFNDLEKFFEDGGIGFYDEDYRSMLLVLKPDEQFMIQTGKRLFKGFNDYNDVHRFQFDLETEGLNPNINAIFQIGIRDNRGSQHIIETKSEYEAQLREEGVLKNDLTVLTSEQSGTIMQERRDSERRNIKQFFNIIDELKPDLITGYNSESFDWHFIFKRCERLSIDIKKIVKTLNSRKTIYRNDRATVKLGGVSEGYSQTNIWGYNVLDISHAVKRAQAINSDIKKWGLKYITKFSEIEKENRVYVAGDILNKTWSDTSDYYFNDGDGDWFKYNEEIDAHKVKSESAEYNQVTGAYIVQRYLMDDLWETEKVDEIYNQAGFLLGKWIPTNFQRSTTMGTAGIWQLLMCGWSYEQGLAIPTKVEKTDFTGGLSRLLEVGYAKDVDKLDYAALYPNIIITHGIYPDFDISGVMQAMIVYIAETRDKYKGLMNEAKGKGDSKLTDFYDKQQLPIKILANSFFGAFGAPHIFPWGDIDCAEEITCRARQYLRLMVKGFFEGYNFRPLVGDTDGFNFARPDNVATLRYTPNGTHRMTEEFAGQELSGVEAVVAEFNELYMIGRMGLDIDDNCKSTINFARKNYANHIIKKNKDGSTRLKLKLVGNTVKSKVMATYIEKFIDKAIIMLLDGDGYSFINHYYDYVEKIFNYQIPIINIASKSKVNETVANYKNVYLKGETKNGQQPSRKAYMELVIKDDLKVDLGDVVYYINTGTAKSHADVKKEKIMVKDEETGKKKASGKSEIIFNSQHIPTKDVEKDNEILKDISELEKELEILMNLDESEGMDPDAHQMACMEIEDAIGELESQLIFVEYNVSKYIEALNSRIKKLFVCFNPDIRDKVITNTNGDLKLINNIMISVVRDKETKKLVLEPRQHFTPKQCELVAGKPFDPEVDQDKYEDLMMFEDKEFNFWIRVNKVPNNIEENEWETLKYEYLKRVEKERKEGIKVESEGMVNLLRSFELVDYKRLRSSIKFPKSFNDVAIYDEEEEFVVSIRYGHKLCDISDIFLYEEEAKLRDTFYKETLKSVRKKDDKFKAWLTHLSEQELSTNTNDLLDNNIEYTEFIFDDDIINDNRYKTHYYNKIGLPLNIVEAIDTTKKPMESEVIKEIMVDVVNKKDTPLKELLRDSDDIFTF